MGIVTNKYNLPKSLYNAIVNDTYTGPKADSKIISVTTLINPPRIHFLKCNHWAEITEDISEAIWKLIGSATHSMIERAESKNDLTEQRIEKEINGLTVSGAFDIYTADQEIHDYKITSAYSVVYNPNGKEDWHKQLNIYKYLLESCGFPVKALKIVAILRDWNESNYKPGGNYPEIPVSVIDIPVWSKEEVEKYLIERTNLFKNCSLMKDDSIYPFCNDEEMWVKSATWAIMKKGRKTAVKVCATEQEAKDNLPNDGQHSIEHRPGDRIRCSRYCQVAKWCNQYQQYLKDKENK